MTASAFAFLFAGVVLNAGAQLLLKAGTNTLGVITLTRDNWGDMLWKMGTQGFFVAGVVCYMISLLVWIIGLSRVDVSIAYPMLSLGYVVNAFAAWYLFGEVLSMQRLIGIEEIVGTGFKVVKGNFDQLIRGALQDGI